MKNVFVLLRSKGVKVVVAISAFAVAASANAALPDWATTMVTAATTSVTDSAAAVGPVIGLALAALITIKLIKRFSNKI